VDRIVGYDLNFHAPKSLSVLQGLTGDDGILRAFRSAVAETMRDIEEQTDTRVRRRGAQELRVTGNLAWAEFVHFTARPVGGIPDPHLHIHAFAMNTTFDDVEGRWKAAMFRQIKKDAPYHEAAFQARLAAKVEALGYGIERTKFGWEVKGIPRTMIEKFSRRTAQIEDAAAAKGISAAKEKDALGALTREGKRRGLSKIDLLTAWGTRLTEQEKVILAKVHGKMMPQAGEPITAQAAVDYAFEKMFTNHSVVQQNRLVAEALRFGVGHLRPEQIWREMTARDPIVRKVGDEVLCTSLQVLAEEVSLVNFVRSGRGQHARLAPAKQKFKKLSEEQSAAVRHVLNSRDQVIVIRGGAGVGKTTLMKETVGRIEETGNRGLRLRPLGGGFSRNPSGGGVCRGGNRGSPFAEQETPGKDARQGHLD
jgi:conjugative relaxase-like TrwC/TraI family protein